ncbi:MAG: class I SAM-dependent methyltransferase [Elusimicrobia bacterium]|nr:class I SAM-dependent methyltransferase [Candidatus Obscuribacterium magneticum]
MKKGFTSRPITRCQICGSKKLESIIFLGFIPPVNTMPIVGSVPLEQPSYPLELLRCPNCTLVQIGLEVNPEILFPPDYPYLSGSTRILRENFAELSRESSQLLGLKPEHLVIDIGSNDGTLLSNFKEGGHRVLGIEPSKASVVANKRGVRTMMAFFDDALAKKVRKKEGPARVITAANVFAHIGDIHSVVKGILTLLDKEGVFISESHYLPGLVETVQYDTIYHEHLRYYSLGSLMFLLEKHGLEVFHAKKIPTHGGSIRVYAARKGQERVHPTVELLRKEEKEAGIDDGRAFAAFRERVIKSKHSLYALLAQLKKNKARIFGIGAPSRASTLINYTGLDDGLIDCVMEVKTSNKVGKYIPGTRIPVLEESKLYNEQPEYALFLSWHIAGELAANLRKNGYRGRFIVPLPEPHLLEA